jgi:HK97 family phage major capsid protein
MFIQLLKDFLGKPAGERIDVAESDAKDLIANGTAVAVQDDPLAPFMGKITQQIAGSMSKALDATIAEALKQFQTAASQARKHAVPAIFGEGNTGDPKKTFGDWLCAVARGDRKYLETHYKSEFVDYGTKAALAEASGVVGGYIVPPEFAQQLLTLVAEKAIVRPRAFVQPMASATLMMPYLDVTTAQAAGTSPFFGGVSFAWTEEAQTRTETEPQFKMLELKAHELSGYAVSSNVLLQDAAFGLERFLMTLFSGATAWYEDYAFFQGNGVGKPLGVLKSPAAVLVNRNGAGLFKYVDASTMISRILPASLQSAVWVVHPYVLPQLAQLADASGRIVWVPNIGGAQDPLPGTLFGRPVLVSEKLNNLGTQGDVCLFDPQLYIIGDRMQLEIAASPHVNFLKNQMTWRIVERVDGQPWLDKAVTLADGATTVSSIVVLN